ncbi:CHAP domain-containing protein [Streptomyces sp. NBC_00249]|uniref:CHAP domain-containing protein n=1 Tax=Streptomyces sp. NBC_00249 TaxID=2975690 RepID=UPI00224D8416|nr:CHAP domain-containing protein [Streptomyces sp. NBC_00249]MCX5198628.1 CHAP domain-containing protein [Streptomyces sp. NBC_00249]
MSRLKTIAIRLASTSALAATAFTMVTAAPAHAASLGDSIASTARAENGNGACAHGGYVGGPEQHSSCSGGRTAHAWCADFAGWVWARNGVKNLDDLTDAALSFYEYGDKHGTLSNTPHVGDAVVFNYGGSYADDHVALVTGFDGTTVTFTGGNQGGGAGIVSTNNTRNWRVGQIPWGSQRISGYISPTGSNAPSYPNPASLAGGTLVKSPSGPAVKVMIEGAGIPVAASDVGPDQYDLSKIVTIDDSAFRSLASAPPAGTVVHDQAGGNERYVVVDGAALKIGAADWTAAGYNTRRDMGVPTAWLNEAKQRSVASGLVVMDQTGKDPSRYVMVDGAALHISAEEWTSAGYNLHTLVGVPGEWLKAATTKTPGNGIVVMNQDEKDPSRYVMVNGAALHIAAEEWTAHGYDRLMLMGVPGSWLASSVSKQVPDGTIIKDASGADASVFVMAGGKAVSLTYADFTGLGYDKRPLEGVPTAWLTTAKTKAAPADHTMLLSQDSNTVWEVLAGKKRAMKADEFGAGKRSFNDVVSVPVAFTASLPTAPVQAPPAP